MKVSMSLKKGVLMSHFQVLSDKVSPIDDIKFCQGIFHEKSVEQTLYFTSGQVLRSSELLKVIVTKVFDLG